VQGLPNRGINLSASSDHVIVLPGGGYAEHAANEGEPIAVAAGVGRRRQRVPLSADGATPRAAYCSPRKLRRAISLDALVTTDAPPFFIWHTAEDPYVPVEHAYRLAASLAAHGVPHAVHVFAHGPHSLGLAIGAGEPAVWTELAKRWIQEQTEIDSQALG